MDHIELPVAHFEVEGSAVPLEQQAQTWFDSVPDMYRDQRLLTFVTRQATLCSTSYEQMNLILLIPIDEDRLLDLTIVCRPAH